MSLSIRLRFTVWAAGLMAIILAGFSAGILWLNARWGQAQLDAELTSVSAAIGRMLDEEIDESRNLRHAADETGTAMDVPAHATAILDAHGTPLVAQWHGFDGQAAATWLDPRLAPLTTSVTQSSGAWRVITTPQHSPYGDSVVLVATPLAPLQQQRSTLRRILFIATPAVVALVALASWVVAASALGPVAQMAAEAERLTAGAPDLRLAHATSADEVGQLGRAFNRLLERLAAAMRQQRQFMTDASHELRTPVSVIRTTAEVTLDRERRGEPEYREALTIVREQSERLSQMVDDMFILARADARGYRLNAVRLYIDDVVNECVRAVRMVATTRAVQLVEQVESDVIVTADAALMHRLVTNLLDNALQHTPARGRVTVGVAREAGGCVITVADTGAGIPPADRERIFDRFVRLDAARGADSGAGLGLAIARWAAEVHGGSLVLADSSDLGSTFVAHLPSTSAAVEKINRA